MKIKNKFIIPLIAVMVALIMVGSPATIVAADTQASDETTETTTTNPAWTHEYTYVPTTLSTEPTSSLEEEIEGAVSNIIGDKADGLDETIRDAADVSGGILRGFSNFFAKLIELVKRIGDLMGGELSLGDIFGSLTNK